MSFFLLKRACQRYSQHWKEIAKETLAWRSSVVRIAAVNCGDSANSGLCRKHNIEHYPTLRVFRAKAASDQKNNSEDVQTGSSINVINDLVRFIIKFEPKLDIWPQLQPYR